MKRYYFTISYLPDNANNEVLAARCISTLHGVLNRKYSSLNKKPVIGIAFPKWCNSTIGNQIAFFSENESKLESFCYHHDFRLMQDEDIFEISHVQLVPESLNEIQFIRNNGLAKMTLAERRRRIERCKRRAEKAGRNYIPKDEHKLRDCGLFHKLIVTSSSSSKTFPLYIQKKSIAIASECDFSHYGLAANEVYTGTVPDLSFNH